MNVYFFRLKAFCILTKVIKNKRHTLLFRNIIMILMLSYLNCHFNVLLHGDQVITIRIVLL